MRSNPTAEKHALVQTQQQIVERQAGRSESQDADQDADRTCPAARLTQPSVSPADQPTAGPGRGHHVTLDVTPPSNTQYEAALTTATREGDFGLPRWRRCRRGLYDVENALKFPINW